MITSLNIQNFQSHKKTSLEFDAGVNVVIGTSDSGKSAVLRALNWVVNNRPAGDAFRSSWGGETSVAVDGVVRTKGKTENSYSIMGEKLKAFGQDVPAEVREALTFSDLNIQRQMDAPFLLSDSPGEIARVLNQIGNLDVIDRALSNVESAKRKAKSGLNFAEQNLQARQNSLKKYEYLDAIESKLKELKKREKGLREMEARERTLNSLVVRMKEVIAGRERFASLPDAIKHLGTIDSLAHKITENRKETERIEGLVVRVLSARKSMASAELRRTEAEEEIHALMPDICPLCGQEVPK